MADSKLNIIISATDKASGAVGGVTKSLGTLGKVAGATVAAGLAATAAGIVAVGAGLSKLAIDAAPIEGIKTAFEGLTAKVEGGSQAMLAALKEQSAGMVSNTDLMKTYNLGAQLVGDTFAQTLPDAMQYLSKVSAATGEDMSYMLDSLVRGVGRLSPMILDNLGIQVDLTAAYDEYAEQLGITVEEMTKTEQQTALMNQVMVKLKKNTADMPEVIGTANQKFESMKVMFTDIKDELGLALLPVFSDLMNTVGEISEVYLPVFVDFFKDEVVPAIGEVVLKAGDFILALLGIKNIDEILDPKMKESILWLQEKFAYIKDEVIPKLVTAFGDIKDWWDENAPLLVDAFETIKAWWLENGPIINEAVKNAFDKLVELGTDLKDEILPGLMVKLEEWKSWTEDNEELISQFFTKLTTGMSDAEAQAWLFGIGLSEGAGGGVEDMAQKIDEGALDIDKVLQDLFVIGMNIYTKGWEAGWAEMVDDPIQVLNSPSIPNIVTKITGLGTDVETLATNWGNSWSGIGTTIEQLATIVGIKLGEVKTAMEEKEEEWKEAIRGLGESMLEGAREKLGEFEQWGIDAVEAIKTGITTAWTTMYGFLSSKISALISWAKGLLHIDSPSGTFAEIGENIVSGLAKGLDDTWGWLKGQVYDKFGNLIAWAMELLGIGSPSRVFFEIGQSIGQGLIDGIETMYDDIADTAYEMQEELLKATGIIGRLGGQLIKRVEDTWLNEYRDKLEAMQARVDEINEAMGGEITEGEWNALYSEREQLLSSIYSFTEGIAEEEERIAAIEQQRADLAFLQEQLKFLSMIEEYGLDESILEGLKLGLNADLPALMDAMAEAMAQMIAAAQDQLGIASPSKVFQDIGRNMMEGIAMGVTGAANLPAMAVAGASQNTTNYWTLNVSESGGVTDPARSFQYLQALVGA